MFGSLGPLELMVIFIIVLIVFGADRLPELARGLGKGIREFKRAADEVKNEIMIDPELNLDLNSPLTQNKEKSKDPYKTEEWEPDEIETSVSVVEKTSSTNGDKGDKNKPDLEADIHDNKKKNTTQTDGSDDNNDNTEKSDSNKSPLLG